MTITAPIRLGPDHDPAPVLKLLRDAFAFMEGRIDPPSSLDRMTGEDLRQLAASSELWVIREGGDIVACVVLTARPGHLYIGKMAVAASHRKQGLARHLVALARRRARALALPELRLQVRVELVENQSAFAAMGFRQIAATSHPGYDRPTSLTLARKV